MRGSNTIEAPEDDQWLQGVIRGVNTQNRVHAYDFRSNEPEQIELQKKFRDLKVFYERKRGEWREFRNEPRFKNFSRVTLVELGQLLTVVADDGGQGVLLVKRGIENVFVEKNYRKLFPSRAAVMRRFEKIYLAYRLYRLLDAFGYTKKKERRRQRHAFWHTLLVLHRAVTSVPRLHSRATIDGIREVFDRFEGNGVWGRRAKKLVRLTRKRVWAAWRTARRADPERWTANNFFKSRFGSRKVLSLALPRVAGELKILGRYIAENG